MKTRYFFLMTSLVLIAFVEEFIRLNKSLIHSIAGTLMSSDELETAKCFELIRDVNLVSSET